MPPKAEQRTERAIVRALRYGPQSVAELARLTGLSHASIRRTVQELRASGYNITFSDGTGLPYRLYEE